MDRLTQWRLARGLSVDEVAQKLRVDPSTIRRYERGKVRPSGPRFTKLAQLLGKTWMELEAYFLLCKENRKRKGSEHPCSLCRHPVHQDGFCLAHWNQLEHRRRKTGA